MAVANGSHMFTFTRNGQTFFLSGCTILNPQQQCLSDPVSLHPCQDLVMSLLIIAILLGVP